MREIRSEMLKCSGWYHTDLLFQPSLSVMQNVHGLSSCASVSLHLLCFLQHGEHLDLWTSVRWSPAREWHHSLHTHTHTLPAVMKLYVHASWHWGQVWLISSAKVCVIQAFCLWCCPTWNHIVTINLQLILFVYMLVLNNATTAPSALFLSCHWTCSSFDDGHLALNVGYLLPFWALFYYLDFLFFIAEDQTKSLLRLFLLCCARIIPRLWKDRIKQFVPYVL